MTTLTTRDGFESFRERMCSRFAELPAGLDSKPLHVTQAALGPNTFFTHRLGDDGHHIVYDPRQVSPLSVRQFLGIYAAYSEGPILDKLREAAYRFEGDAWRKFHEAVIHEIDRAQDPDGVVDQVLELISRENAGVTA